MNLPCFAFCVVGYEVFPIVNTVNLFDQFFSAAIIQVFHAVVFASPASRQPGSKEGVNLTHDLPLLLDFIGPPDFCSLVVTTRFVAEGLTTMVIIQI